jgi:hypothetical protein
MATSINKSKDRRTDWYSVSVDTLKGWSLVLLIAVIGVVSYFGYKTYEKRSLESKVADLLDEAQALTVRIQREQKAFLSRGEYKTARDNLHQAQERYTAGDFREARPRAQRSVDLLRTLIYDLSPNSSGGLAKFVSTQGEVEFRRGGSAEWQEARNHLPLHPGDSVRTTGGGSAEITFADGTLYTVRPNTQFIVSALSSPGAGKRPEQTIEMEYGWVDLSTRQISSSVKTPSATARVSEDSEAFVSVDRATSKGRFGSLRGLVELSSASGATRQIRNQEQVVQQGTELSEPKPLTPAPQLLGPEDNFQVVPENSRNIQLAWNAVPGARRYALQVSANHLFVDNVIDVENRTKTTATLEARGEGSFHWRVAAFGADGLLGPWSGERTFRVPSLREIAAAGRDRDTTPPKLDLEDVKSYGNIFIVGGRTEPSARIEINGDPVKSNVDGTFTKTVQLTQGGWSFIEVLARDEAGNKTVHRHRVFVENSY